MISVKIDEDIALELLMERVEFWTSDKDIQNLYRKMYQNYLYDDMVLDVRGFVDNDYVNWCSVIEEGEDFFDDLLEVYKKQGIGDCSCEGVGWGWIEAVDDEANPTMFLVRQ